MPLCRTFAVNCNKDVLATFSRACHSTQMKATDISVCKDDTLNTQICLNIAKVGDVTYLKSASRSWSFFTACVRVINLAALPSLP